MTRMPKTKKDNVRHGYVSTKSSIDVSFPLKYCAQSQARWEAAR